MSKKIYLLDDVYALVDDEDYEWLSTYTWYYHSAGYAMTENSVLMHRMILNSPKGIFTDHVNRNRLDNRKSNLRMCTVSENNKNKGMRSDNKSGYKGVHWDKRNKKWRARIVLDKKSIHLGLFSSIEYAVKAYDEASPKYHKEFSSPNT
jgi:hypothetical protein